MNKSKSLISGATTSYKEVNQDFFLTKHFPALDCTAIVVADGLGSYAHSELAAEFVCKNTIEIIGTYEHVNQIHLPKIFEEVQVNLQKEFVPENGTGETLSPAYGTTLICCLETINEFIVGYVGNGGVFHIRGDFNTFPERFYLPWNSINLLNPHSIEEGGRNAMYKLIHPKSTYEQLSPSIIKIKKENFFNGDILMICSDGIYSYDEVQIGKDPNGKIWISGEESMETFYKHLNDFFIQEKWSEEELEKRLNTYLNTLSKNQHLDDDATLALIITSKALKFQEKQKEKTLSCEENSEHKVS